MRAAAVKRVVNPTSMRTTLGTTARYPMPIAQATPMPDISRNIRVGSSENRYRLIGAVPTNNPAIETAPCTAPRSTSLGGVEPELLLQVQRDAQVRDDEYASEQERDRVRNRTDATAPCSNGARRGSRACGRRHRGRHLRPRARPLLRALVGFVQSHRQHRDDRERRHQEQRRAEADGEGQQAEGERAEEVPEVVGHLAAAED